ncbi:MAG: glycosyltransferase family 4 protein [Actinomycetota bacterium]|nr:glycosyltransferase family 4 protein [Actinomycetota bacterium]
MMATPMGNQETVILGIVNNDITNDTRVKRVAASAAAAGYTSQILGFAPNEKTESTAMGAVKIERVAVPIEVRSWKQSKLVKSARSKSGRTILFFLQPNFLRPVEIFLRRLIAAKPFTRLKRKFRYLVNKVLKWVIKLGVNTSILNRALENRKLSNTVRATMRKVTARDFESHFGGEIERIKPTLIHAHDFHMIGVAVEAAEMLRDMGHETKVVYDAHELVEGLDHLESSVKSHWLAYEEKYIHRVDGIVCVSKPQAKRLQERYELSEQPSVILNCPILEDAPRNIETIRDHVAHNGKLLVYHGKASRARGLETFVESLEYLDSDIHIALIVNIQDTFVKELKSLAEAIGKRIQGAEERLHLLPYVEAADLPTYLSTADIAVIPLHSTGNHEVAMPNKLFEAIQAKLPVLTSERKALSEYVKEKSIGMVFADNDPKKLAETTHSLIENLDEFKSRFSEEFLQECSWDSQSKILVKFYEGILGLPASPIKAITVEEIQI